LSGVFLAEGLPLRLMLGCAVALAGCGVIALATSTHGISDVVAALLCVAAALTYAVALVVEKPLLTRASPLTVTWSACTVGAVVCLPFLPQLVAESLHAGAGALAWVVYLGLLPTAAGFSLWAFALARTTAGRLGATTYLVPPVAVLMGWLLLGDVPQTLAFAGGALCLLGVAVARGARWPRRRRAAAEPVSA
jgi:drug/metabolite transporter (DMT)-like permease